MKSLYIALMLTSISMTFASCSDNNYMEIDKGNVPLELSTNISNVVLLEANHSATAMELSWTSGTNAGTSNRISYTLQLALAGTEFANPLIVNEDMVQIYTWTFSVENLNSLLIESMSVEAGSTIDLEARIIADVIDKDLQQIAQTSFTVTTYKEVSPNLYLIGDATPNGWNADNATEMYRTDNGIFTWTGNLTKGEFKFITDLGSFLPSYNNGGNNTIVYRRDDTQPDDKFIVTESHCYQIDVNLLDLTITINQVEGEAPMFDHLYFVGNETEWSFWPMTQDPLDPFLFRIGVFFNQGGEFKFGTSDGSWENMYKAIEPNAPYTSEAMVLVPGFEPDNKWLLKDDEINLAYKICVDIRTGKERMMMRVFTPFTEMYLVGDATPNGWDLDNATPMVQNPSDPNIFTWHGHLNTGEIKFSADKQSDWNGAWYMADQESKTPTGMIEKVIFIDKSDNCLASQYVDIAIGDIDYKWRITESGNYTITLNQMLDEITFTKN